LEIAKQAVAVDNRNKRGWHLLGLILTAIEDMKGALQVFETAIDLDTLPSVDELSEDPELSTTTTTHRDTRQDALAKLEGLEPSSTLPNLREEQDRWEFPITETEKLEIDTQLRLSKNVVIEYLEGPASALEDQRELLAWFSKAYLPIAEALGKFCIFFLLVRSSTTDFCSLSLPLSFTCVIHSLALAPTPTTTTTTLAAAFTSSEGTPTTANLSKRKSLLGRRVSLRSKRDSTTVTGPSALPPPVGTAASTTLSVPPGLSPSAATTPYASVAPSRAASRNPSTVDLSLQGQGSTSTMMKGPDLLTNPRATKLLVNIWLASAASFRRAGKLEESRGAIWEAEQLNRDDPEVWSSVSFFLFLSLSLSLGVEEGRVLGMDVLNRRLRLPTSLAQFLCKRLTNFNFR
jgi:hypothetical protein